MLRVERADVQGQLNAPLLQRLLDAGLGTQQVAGVSEGNPTPIEQLVDVRGEQQAVVAVNDLKVVLTFNLTHLDLVLEWFPLEQGSLSEKFE